MKILVVTHNITPTSGTGRYSRRVLDEYDRKGISYKVITEVDDLVPLRSLAAGLKNIRTIRRALSDCDIIHVFDGWPYAVYARLALLFTSKKLFVNAVGTYAVAALRSPWKGPLLKNAYRRAERVYAISHFVKDNVLKYMKLRTLEVAYLGTTPMPTPSPEVLAQFKDKYSISSEHPILLTVGAIKDRKGQFETLEAVAQLKNNYPHILYCIVGTTKGNDAYAEKIQVFITKNSLEKNVRIMSDLKTDTDLACAYSLSTIFLLNSKYDTRSEHSEGFGLVLLEAAQFGKPVIGSKGSGIPEAMEEGYNGYLVDTVEKESIVHAIEKVLVRYDELVENSRKVAQKFSWEKTADAYIKGYTN